MDNETETTRFLSMCFYLLDIWAKNPQCDVSLFWLLGIVPDTNIGFFFFCFSNYIAATHIVKPVSNWICSGSSTAIASLQEISIFSPIRKIYVFISLSARESNLTHQDYNYNAQSIKLRGIFGICY